MNNSRDNNTVPFAFVINAVVHIPFSLIATVGNSLILVSFSRTPSLLSPSNVLLTGLAISDLCVGLIAQPLYITSKFQHHIYPTQTISVLNKVDVVFHFFSRMLCAVSFLIVLFLSVDRFLAVHFHLRYHEIVTVRRVTLFV